MKKLLEMFWAFFKIGAFTIGGGYAMIPLIQKEVVYNKKWIEEEEFLDMMAIAQSAPGPIAVNVAVFVGYKLMGPYGVIATTLGSVLPSFAIILCVALFFSEFRGSVVMEKAFKAVRPVVVALIAAPVINMAKAVKINRKTLILPGLVAILVGIMNITPILIILVFALGGVIYIRPRKEL